MPCPCQEKRANYPLKPVSRRRVTMQRLALTAVALLFGWYKLAPRTVHVRGAKTGLQAFARTCCYLVRLLSRWGPKISAADPSVATCVNSILTCATVVCQKINRENP